MRIAFPAFSRLPVKVTTLPDISANCIFTCPVVSLIDEEILDVNPIELAYSVSIVSTSFVSCTSPFVPSK